MKILFVTDIHGSKLMWDKAIIAATQENIDLLIIAGDLVGKQVTTIVESDKISYFAIINSNTELINAEELESLKNKNELYGSYTIVLTKEEYEILQKDKELALRIYSETLCERIDNWLTSFNQKKNSYPFTLLISPGNDDPFNINNVLIKYNSINILAGIDNVVNINNYSIVNFSRVNKTPWKTPREMSEQKIYEKLKFLLKDCQRDKLIFNFHCPPYESQIDKAPMLDGDLKLNVNSGAIKLNHIGSISIKNIIEEYQPIISFHGHVHESAGVDRIKNTIMFNPGSEYAQGIMKGYIVKIVDDSVSTYYRIER